MPNGIIFVDKPAGFTSHDIVAKLRRKLGTKKVGHAGTLDPMATGLLTIGVGASTRLLTYLVGLNKTYETTIFLGAATVTDDREGEITETASSVEIEAVTEANIYENVRKLTGNIEQIPSKVSAIKVNGKRAYDLVRQGEEIELKPRPVTIHSFEISNIRRSTGGIEIDATVDCSSGTYIRALARDLGKALKIGGHLTYLRRTKVGPFEVEKNVPSMQDPEEKINTVITAPEDVAKQLFVCVELNEKQSVELLQGKRFKIDHEDAALVAALNPQGKLLGLIEIKNGLIKAITNFPQN